MYASYVYEYSLPEKKLQNTPFTLTAQLSEKKSQKYILLEFTSSLFSY